MIDLLSTIDDLLLLYLCTDDIKPVGEKFSNALLEEVHALFEFKCLFELDDDLVERVEVITVITTTARKMHDC